MWCDVGQVFKSVDNVKKNHKGAEGTSFSCSVCVCVFFFYVRESARGRERDSNISFDDPWSSIDRNSSSQELKFIYSTRATRVYQKRGISPKIQRRRFGEIKVFGFLRCSRDLLPFYYAPRCKGSFYFGLFPTLGLF